MGRLGFGAGRFRVIAMAQDGRVPGPALESISPAQSWTGVAGSGFAAAPADPVRVTAKPAMRIIVPPNQFFTDELLVGVYAGANDGGSLLDNMGLAKVVAHYEGASSDILSPSYQTFPDANGNRVSYFGWWIVLKRDGRDGDARLYFEAIPADPEMQARVIGPYQFSPRAALHDFDLTIAPSQAVITGQRYQDFGAALTYLCNSAAQNPRITFVEAGSYAMSASFQLLAAPAGWCRVEASAPITFVKPSFTGDAASYFRPKGGYFHFRGGNITFDFANTVQFYTEAGHRLWLDGVNIVNSDGVARLLRGGPPIVSKLFREKPYFTECVVSDNHNAATEADLVRGGRFTNCSNDLFTDSVCVLGSETDGLNNDHLARDVEALRVQYLGTGAAATLEWSGTSDAGGRVLTARVDGASVGTFTAANSEAAWRSNTNYTVRNVADWLNALPDWSAVLIDDSRRATGLSLPGNRGAAFGAADAKSAPLTLVTHFDLHSDWWAQNVGGAGENVVVADNRAINLRAQNIFVTASSPTPRDVLFLNNALSNQTDNPTGFFENTFAFSQLGKTAHSHVVVAHNSLPTQGLYLRTDLGYNPDGYCLVANNAFRSAEWNGKSDTDLAIAGNHLQAGATIPAAASGTSIGGTAATLFAQHAAGDFTPQGELLANLKPPVLKFDRSRSARPAQAPAGALA